MSGVKKCGMRMKRNKCTRTLGLTRARFLMKV
jgi:hypothetical protein